MNKFANGKYPMYRIDIFRESEHHSYGTDSYYEAMRFGFYVANQGGMVFLLKCVNSSGLYDVEQQLESGYGYPRMLKWDDDYREENEQ